MNSLHNETSPYLLQHADNPVAWYPWGEAALEIACRENKPILLSIGYSACHWCHVMAHESFEDGATAELMNEHFVNIKVDREERPDIDKIYQQAHSLLTQNQGGWPLTMFLTPDDQVPFLGGTYFPDEARHGLPSFKDLLVRVAATYREREDDIRAQNQAVLDALNEVQAHAADATQQLDLAPIATAYEQAQRAFDHRFGGFSRAPKFPHAGGIERLLRDDFRAQDGDEQARHMALLSLRRMANGGIYDHLGGGFFRYSTDDQWMIPHFEKMLYDNGPLLGLYAQAWQITGEPVFKTVVEETVAWLQREMTSPQGSFYSSLDADSEGTEGKFYAWDLDQVSALAGADFESFARRFGLNREANFAGRWHLRTLAEHHEIANVIGGDAEDIAERIDQVRIRLFNARESRIRPDRDEKILTSWNALMIKGLALAGGALAREDYVDSAVAAIDFIRTTLWRDGRLLATCKDEQAHLNAYLDDHAFLLDALLHVLSVRWRAIDLSFAQALAECLLEEFQDDQHGGFFFTAHAHERLIQRTKSFNDDALPAGNGIAAWALARLGHLLGEPRYLAASEKTLAVAWTPMTQAPLAHAALSLALEEFIDPPSLVILRGHDEELRSWRAEIDKTYAPNRMVFSIPTDEETLPGLLAAHRASDSLSAYVCRGHQCLAPITDLSELIEELAKH